MQASYNKLWKLLIDLKMKKGDLLQIAGISSCSLAKLGKDEDVSMRVLKKICEGLHCNIGDIMDFYPDKDVCIHNDKRIAKNLSQKQVYKQQCVKGR